MKQSLVCALLGAFFACSSDPGMGMGMDGPDAGPPGDAAPSNNRPDYLPLDDDGCPGIFAQDRLPTFELTISDEVWALFLDEVENGWWREEMGIEHNPYHPLDSFKWQDIEITDAAIRLRGNPEYWNATKMQWQIKFNEYNKIGRFLGLRRVLFDAATANRSFLRDRLALYMMRRAGIKAPCANNARLVVNGEYYGLFTSIEKIDKEFLERKFDDPEGDLWKRASWEIKTNEDTTTDERLEAMKDATTAEELGEYLDIAQSIRVWATDALVTNGDGPWAGGLNFYLYDDPTTGTFKLLPWDLDQAFTLVPYDVDPFTWHKEVRFRGRPFYDISLAEPMWFDLYIDTIEDILTTVWDVDATLALVDAWAEQIHDSVYDDPNKPFEYTRHLERLDELRAVIQLRHLFVQDWLVCWQTGGVDDGDGNCVMP